MVTAIQKNDSLVVFSEDEIAALTVAGLTDAELGEQIAAAVNESESGFRQSQELVWRSLFFARKAGRLLNLKKAQIKGDTTGRWLAWLKESCCCITTRTAQRFMELDRGWDELNQLPGFEEMSYTAALKFLSKLNEPEPEVIQAELVEEEEAPAPKPSSVPKFKEGDTAYTAKGQAVEVVRKIGQVYIAQDSQGVQSSYLPLELSPPESTAAVKPQAQHQASVKELLNQAIELLKRCQRCNLDSDLQEEIQKFLS